MCSILEVSCGAVSQASRVRFGFSVASQDYDLLPAGLKTFFFLTVYITIYFLKVFLIPVLKH